LATRKDITDLNKKSSITYYETPTDSLFDATNAFMKAQKLNVKNIEEYTDKNSRGLGDCYYALQNTGIQRFNKDEFSKALNLFEMASDISASQKKFDSLMISNVALSAYNAKIYDKAIVNYKKLADAGYGKGHTWSLLGSSYLKSGDSANYIKAISDGMKKYPTDPDLLVEDVNIKMNTGHSADAIAELNALVAQRPNDSQLNAVVGNVYDKMANPDSGNGHPAPKPKNYEELIGKAAEYYKKAIELDAKNFDANYNLGVLYYMQSMYYFDLSQQSIADAAKYKNTWDKGLPDAAKYLEAAHAIDPKDLTTLSALKICYGQMGDDANYTRIKEEIKKVQSGQ
jgi:TPR repeat protein